MQRVAGPSSGCSPAEDILAGQGDSCAWAENSNQVRSWAEHVHLEGVGAEQELHSVRAGVLQRVVVLAAVEGPVEVEVEQAWDPKASARHRAATSCAAMTIR